MGSDLAGQLGLLRRELAAAERMGYPERVAALRDRIAGLAAAGAPPGRGDPWLMTRPAEAAIAAASDVRLCRWCEDRHFRPYPEQPGYACYQIECECWCNTRQAEAGRADR